ncbi:transcriptional regulator SlyA [Mariniflexile rhizosphaerae]|uniref:MarR family winged helix-turn-helix transcriptional regulator n=1 Tax=unclassified Mariniflexile TaxID=2643887 RepID=UPI000E332BF1|nr:MarR family transcriptional regulator [Mariniflexile sp. TRM1-10]AXP79802.1 transcriptional regulator SlyA [Mariniflexile sp. TRM1-10]
MNKENNYILDRPEDDLGYLLLRTTTLWQRQMTIELHTLDLSFTQCMILISLGWLLQNSDDVVQMEISNHSNFDRMMVSKTLRTLQQRGLIKRKEHGTDTRAKCVFLTNKGIDTLKKVIEIKTNINNYFFEKLEIKDSIRKELKKLIN